MAGIGCPVANEKVGRFDILVNELAIMSMLKRLSSLLDKVRDIVQGKPFRAATLLQPISKRALRTVWHDHIREQGFLDGFFAKVIERQNMRVIERGDSSHFTLEEASRFSGS